ncbi:50S ribosomal protein L28 [Candidatus Karelsulcia muelleri]
MSQLCQITGKTNVFGKQISHSNKKSSRIFKPNLFRKRIFIMNNNKFIHLLISKKGLKILYKKGLYKNISHYEHRVTLHQEI